jgi:enoyl-CoA hydratase/carnithine racemase
VSTSSSNPSDTGPVLLEELGEGIARITLNRPHKRNALDSEARALFRSFLKQTRDTKVVIITGAGETFCSGMDLTALTTGDQRDADELSASWEEIQDIISRHPAIVIASVAGYALGGGATLLNVADLAVVAQDAQIGLPEIGFGYYSGIGGPAMQLRLGAKRAAWMVLTAKRIDGVKAEQWGLANLVVPVAELENATLELARHVAQFDAVTLDWSKRALWHVPARLAELRPAIEYGNYVNAQIHTRSSSRRASVERFISGTPNPGQGTGQ